MSAVREVDVLVVGGGPAGLSAARRLRESGVGCVLVLEREEQAGGVPRHCFHPGYGLRDRRTVTTGPRYAASLVSDALDAGAEIQTATMVTGWADPEQPHVVSTSSRGVQEVRARAVLLATGVRERPRPARLVPGDRPAGVWTTGRLQQAVHLHRQHVGRRAVVVGAELVSYSAVMTLRDAGCEVVAIVTEQHRPETYRVAQSLARSVLRVPLVTDARVSRITGRPRVQEIELTRGDGATRTIACDTVVFTADWIPDNELARAAGISLGDTSLAPTVDTALATARPGIYAAGNLVHPAETADLCSLGGRHAADSIVRLFADGDPVGAVVATDVDSPVAWVSPQVLRLDRPPVRGKFVLRASEVVARATIEVRQGARVLHQQRVPGGLLPGRPVHVPSGWLTSVDPTGGPVVFRGAGGSVR
jgi:thioredoxin reductase